MNARTDLDETECRAREVAVFRAEFLRYAAMDDLSQPCPIGRLVSDHRFPNFESQRRQTIAEVIADELESRDNMPRAVGILCKLAHCTTSVEAALASDQLLRDLADGWAERRSEL